MKIGKNELLLARKSLSTRRNNRFLLKKLPPPNFKNFNKTLNKGMLFQLDKKSVPLAGIKNSLKNTFPLDGKTVLTARNISQMEKKKFSLARKPVSTKSTDVFL